MPKYKSPGGRIKDSIREVLDEFCDKNKCYCTIGDAANEQGETCNYYAAHHPEEAARLMGYEIIEDDCDQTATDSNQEAKSDGGKPRPSLVPPALILGVDAIREYGCKKYNDPENWRRVDAQRYWEATLRHALAAWNDWKAVDEESGMPAIWHMACNLAFLMQYMEEGNTDD